MPKPLDKQRKKWYHIYIIGDNYARLRAIACGNPRKKGLFKPPNQQKAEI